MRRSLDVRRTRSLLVGIVVAACGRTDATRRDADIVVRPPLDTIESLGALATRREAQAWLDAAREGLTLQRSEDAAVALSDAATFLHAESREAPGDAGPALEGAAEQLDSLAGVVAHGQLRSPQGLDRVYANVHAAEALRHLLQAHGSMMRRENARAGEELMMSIDHLERAAKDARVHSDPIVQAAIADTRSLADEMMRGMEAVPDEAARMTDEIERAIRRIGSVTAGKSARLAAPE